MACVRSSPSCARRPDLHLEIEDTATSGDTVWFRIRATGTNDGPMWGRPATGRPIDITVMDVMRVADGRMVSTGASPTGWPCSSDRRMAA